MRYKELDSLRGLAALCVLFSHFGQIFLVWYSKPIFLLGIFGHESVMFFFMLSGFVLSLFFIQDKKMSYPSYLIRRICRIYIPYLVTILLTFLCFSLFARNLQDGFQNWFLSLWHTELTSRIVLDHVLLIGYYNSTQFLVVIWSLIEEMRISIVFPLLMIPVLRFSWKVNLALGFLLTATGCTLHFVTPTNYPATVHYMAIFIFGALLAKYRNEWIPRMSSIHPIGKLTLVLLGAVCFAFAQRSRFIVDRFIQDEMLRTIPNDYFAALGACLFIVVALSSRKASQFLHSRIILFLGKVSYSLYLIHLLVALTVTHLLSGYLDPALILALSFVLSIAGAALSYAVVEKPAMNLGKYLTKQMGRAGKSRSVPLNQ